VEKYGRIRQATDDNIIWRKRITDWIKKLRTHTGIKYYLLLWHGESGYKNAPVLLIVKLGGASSNQYALEC